MGEKINFNSLLKAAETNKKGLIRLKEAAVSLQQFEIASQLRELERKIFPETEESIAAKEKAKKLNLLFKMVDLKIPEDKCWLIAETLTAFNEKKGSFSIEDAAIIRAKEVGIFLNED